MIGTEIASYRILEKLGEGGMGVVYKAVDTALDRMVAIKVLSSEFSRNPELVERFRAEARAQANLNHTNLATLYTFLVQDGNASMVMEFVDGETFEQMVSRRGQMSAQDAVPLFRQVLLGIGYAHRAGIIHRDIKPSNLMLNRSGIVKVMDFGIAKVIGARGLTRTGTLMGTRSYMSPEQVMDNPLDTRSDIYSLGVTLYQMLTAHVPFEGDSDFQIMSDHVNTPPPLLTRFCPSVPKGVENAVLKALEKYPEQRFQTVEEFGIALEHPDDFTYSKLGSISLPVVPIPAGTRVDTDPPYPVVPMAASITGPAAGAPTLTPAQMLARFAVPRTEVPLPPPAPPPQPVGLLGTPTRKMTAAGVALLLILAAAALALKSGRKGTPLLSTASSQTQSPAAGQTPLETRLNAPDSPPPDVSSANSAPPPAATPPAATSAPTSTSASTPASTPAPAAAQPPSPPPAAPAPKPRPQQAAPAEATPAPAPAPAVPAPVAPVRPRVAIPQAVVAFNVVHDHGGVFRPGGAPSCWGRLRVAGTRLEYHVVGSNDGRKDELAAEIAQVQQVQANRLLIHNQQAFHVVVNGQNFNFIPQGLSAPQAATMLRRAIEGR